MRRGEVYLVDFEPSLGAEVAGRRPAIVVSNEGANRGAQQRGWGVVDVVPLTANVREVLPFQVLIEAQHSGLDADSKAQPEQISAVSIGRVDVRPLGTIPPLVMNAVDEALRTQLVL